MSTVLTWLASACVVLLVIFVALLLVAGLVDAALGGDDL